MSDAVASAAELGNASVDRLNRLVLLVSNLARAAFVISDAAVFEK